MATLKKIVNKRLGEILEDAGYLTEENIANALKIQKESGERLGEIVVKEGYCSPENIIRALVNQLNAPFLRISGFKFNNDLIKKIPYTLAMNAGLIPLEQIGSVVLMAITGPVNSEMYAELESYLGGSLHLCIADMNEVKAKIESVYPEAERKAAKKSRVTQIAVPNVSAKDHAATSIVGSIKAKDPTKEEVVVDDGMTGLGSLLLGD